MNAAGFRFRYALRSLVRSGQRSALGVLCIGFGVLCLVAMQLVAGTVRDGIVFDPRLAIGGDLRIAPPDGRFDAAAYDRLAHWQRQGLIRRVALVAPTSARLIRPAAGGRVLFLSAATGVADAYPLVGGITGLNRARLAQVIANPGDVLLTADVARALGAVPGDSVVLGSLTGGAPVRLRVSAVAHRLPDRRAGVALFGLATAARLDAPPRAALILTAPGASIDAFTSAGWTVRTPADAGREAARVADLFGTMLKGAGLLGLLVGALAVVNTMHVALARRTPELATLKTLGYTARDLLVLLGLEVLMLGAAGTLLGAGAGVATAAWLIALLSRVQGSMSLVFNPDARVIAGGFLVGLSLATAAGMLAAARASRVRPALLLRQQEPPLDRHAAGVLASLAVALLALFTGVAAAVMGSLARGVGVVLATLVAGTLVLGLLAIVLGALLRTPLPHGGLLGMARRNLAHRRCRSLLALAALAVGVFSIGFAAATLLSGRDELIARQARALGADIAITASASASARVEHVLGRHSLSAVRETGTSGSRWLVEPRPGTPVAATADLLGRELPEAMVISTRDVAELLTRAVRALFTFAAAVALLALVAGAVLIANAVGLGLLERRRELAMLKAIGYSRAQVLRVILLENGLLGAIGSGFGLLGTLAAAAVSNQLLPQAHLRLHLPASVALLITGIALCIGTALAVAWPATRVRPLVVLRED